MSARHVRGTWIMLCIAAAVLVADLTTKVWAATALSTQAPVEVIGDHVRWTLVYNSGTAFGLFPGQRLPFIVFSSVAIGIIVFLFARMQERTATRVTAMGLLLGGAAGNLHDRIRFGEVTDFIQVGVAGHYWPVFNVADSAITVGVSLLCWSLLRAPVPPPTTGGGALDPEQS